MANPEHLAILRRGVKVWNEWRRENPEVVPNLHSADLIEASLIEADLTRANLHLAELIAAGLDKAVLIEADLTGAKLDWAGLREADLREAELSGADLSGANLTRANLRGADLSGAVFGATKFLDTDLTDCKGLGGVSFWYGSALDPRTVERSGELPISFLRGCGWPERLIEYWPSISQTGIQFYSAFVSYSHADKRFARRLHDELQERGVRCWLDEHQLLPGDNLRDQIDRGIRIWDKVLLCCSEASLTSWWVDAEVEKALAKEERLWKEKGARTYSLLPLNLDRYLFDEWESGKKSTIMERKVEDFRGWKKNEKKFEAALERVIKALRSDEGARAPDPEPKL